MITTVIGAYCPVCRKDQFHILSHLVEREIRDGETVAVKYDNDKYTLECDVCHSVECTVETFLQLG
jgi:hypothetical protein